jgi:hypothetical protein
VLCGAEFNFNSGVSFTPEEQATESDSLAARAR